MTVSSQESLRSQGTTATTQQASAVGVAIDGLFAGVLGGLCVAVFFLIFDVFYREPLYTPSLLGCVLFLGKNAGAVEAVNIPMAFAYTGVHMLAFVAVGMATAYMVSQFEKNPPFGLLLLLLFICFQAGFIAFTAALIPGVIGGELDTVQIVAANLLSALAMAAYLLWRSHPGAVRSLNRISED